jgi:D-glycero-D-manno-heptose 1,7-bisphosphate phosphatase
MKRPVVFLDRDGTLIEDRHYIRSPDEVRLLPHAADAVRQLNAAGVAAVVITNQSGIARGLLGEPEYAAVRDRVDELLAAAGARLDASFHCPHHPVFTGPCPCRKPGIALHERALRELDLDAARTATIGDRWHDVEPARTLGGTGILVPSTETSADEVERARADALVATDLLAAVDHLLRRSWKTPA